MNDNVSPWGQTHEERIDELEAYVERLDAQIAALKAERDTLKSDNGEYHGVINDAHRWCDLAGVNGGPLLARLQLVTQHIALLVAQTSELRAERDAAEDRVRVLEEQLSETHRKIANQRDANRRLTEDAHRRKAELAAMKSVAHTEARNWTLTANRLIAARQSRARLVRLVRAKNGEFNHLMKLWGEARAWAAGWRRKAMKSHAMYVHMHAIYHRSNGSANIFGVPYETVVDNALKLFSRAISGTAQQERSWRRMETVSRRARRAAEAAEAQERR